MMKCFFVLALLSTAACSGASPDDASSQRNAVDGKGEIKGDDNVKPGTTEASDGTVPSKDLPPTTKPGTGPLPAGTEANDGCSAALTELQGMMDTAAASVDIALMAGLKNKYALTEQSCNPPSTQSDSCGEALATLEKNTTAALAVGDAEAVIGFKEKYVDTLASCGATTVSSDGNDGTKPGVDGTKPGNDGASTPAEKPTTEPAPLPEKK